MRLCLTHRPRSERLALGLAELAKLPADETVDPFTGEPLLMKKSSDGWSIYSVVSKPMAGRVSPVVWTYLATTIGAAMTLEPTSIVCSSRPSSAA